MKRPKICRRTTTWRSIQLRIDERHDYLIKGQTHLEIHVISPRKAPIPITTTGYRSHFMDTKELSLAGGAVAFVLAWLDQAAVTKDWKVRDFAYRQHDLFKKD